MKRLILTENQIKNVIDSIINEQKVLSKKTETKPSKVYNISNSFASGQYKLTNTKDIIDAMNSINSEIEGFSDNQKFIITIESSESAVPPPKGMAVGDLSRLRGEAVKDFLKNGNYVPEGANVEFKNLDKGMQGPDWDPKKGKDWVEYKKNQYVTLSLQIIGSRTVTTICNFEENKSGGVARVEDDFVGYTKTFDIKSLPNGTKLKIMFAPHQMADMLVVQSGKNNISTGFVSNSPKSPQVNASVATALYYGYKGKIPTYFPGNIMELDKEDANIIFANTTMEGFKNLFGHVMPSQYFNWSKNIFMNSVKLFTFRTPSINQTNNDDPDFKKFNPSNDGSIAIVIPKDDSTTSLTVKVYSPVGGTIWSLGATCL
jgi:hypothetical protein